MHGGRDIAARPGRSEGDDVACTQFSGGHSPENGHELRIGSLAAVAWAETVIQSSVKQLGEEYAASGRRPLFAEIQSYLSRPADRAAYTQSGRRLDISADAVAMAVVRLRRRYREIVRNQVAQTVATPAEIDDEMSYLVRLLTL